LSNLNESDYRSYRDNFLDKRHEDTCNWLLADERYNFWLRSADSNLLWVHGGPGCRKSVLSSYLTLKLAGTYPETAKEDARLVAYFFCDDKDENLKTAMAILRNLVIQILRQAPKYFGIVLPEYNIRRDKTGAVSWMFDQLCRIFSTIIVDVDGGQIVCLVDALDECEETSREQFLHRLRKALRQASNKGFKVLITSRSYIPVTEGFICATEVALEARNLDKDIQHFVKNEASLLAKKKGFPTSMEREI